MQCALRTNHDRLMLYVGANVDFDRIRVFFFSYFEQKYLLAHLVVDIRIIIICVSHFFYRQSSE